MKSLSRHALLLAVMGVALPAQGRGADPELDALVAQLDDAEYTRRTAAYMTLLRQRTPALLTRLVAALPQMQLAGQALGLTLIQGFPDDEERDALRQLLRAPAPFLQLGAAAILVRAGETKHAEQIVGPLRRDDVDAATKRAMLARLYALHEPKVDAAVLALVTPATDPGVVDGALGYLLQTGVADGRPAAAGLADDANADAATRGVAAAFLWARGDASRLARIAGALDDAIALARMHRFLLAGGALPEPIVQALSRLAEAGSTLAVSLLAQKAGDELIPLFQKLATHQDTRLAKAALDALQRRGAGVSSKELGRMLSDRKPEVALNAADLMRRNDDHTGLPRVIELGRSAGTHQAEAMRVLGRFRTPEAVPALLDGLASPDLAVRTAAEQAVALLLPSLFPYRRFQLAATGYAAGADEATRTAALAQLRAWWEQHRPR